MRNGMPQWEYKILWLPPLDADDKVMESFDRRLASSGMNGWEAVSMNDGRVLLKRRAA